MVKNKLSFEFILLFAVFIIATCGLIYELIAGTVASYLLGDSIKQFSFIIGLYLFSMGIGSYFSKFITKNLLNKFVEIEILVGFIGGISSTLLFLIFEITDLFEFILYFLVFLTGTLVGLEIPLLMNILKDKVEFKDLVSKVFTFDYIGALLASVLFPIFFVPYLGIIRTSLLFGMINILIAIILCFYLKKELKNIFILKFKAISCLIILIILFVFSENILKYSEEKLYNEKIIYSKTTNYQRIVLTHYKNDYRLYLNNNLQFSSFDEYRYHELLVHPAISIAENKENILILGGGDGLAIREILKYKNIKKITLVDLDKGMTNLFKSNKILTKINNNSLNNNKVEIINQDAYSWILKCKSKFDLIYIDFPDPTNYSLGKLYSYNFYKSLKKNTTENTLITIQTTSPFFAPKSFWCINKTLESVFNRVIPFHNYVPSFGDWGFCLVSNQKNFNINDIKEKVTTKFYEYKLDKFTYFPKDIKKDSLEINKINNQILVSYFQEDWTKF